MKAERVGSVQFNLGEKAKRKAVRDITYLSREEKMELEVSFCFGDGMNVVSVPDWDKLAEPIA